MTKQPITFISSLLIGMLIFLGLPLIAWGLKDLGEFFSNPARLGYAILIADLQIFALIYNPRVGKHEDNPKSGIKTNQLDIILIQIFSLAIMILAPLSDRHSLWGVQATNLMRFVGLGLLFPGFILMQVAEKQLEKQFSIRVTLQPGHQLIQTGVYRYLRHPRYLGITLFFAGISLVFNSWLAIYACTALFGILLWRIQEEETLMSGEFGEEWQAYCTRSWKMIPFVY